MDINLMKSFFKKWSILAFCSCRFSVFAIDNPVFVDVNLSPSTQGVGLNIGYRFNNYLGIEGGAIYSPSYAYCDGSCKSYYMLDVAVKGVLPLGDLVSLYGKLGVGLNEYSAPISGSGYLGTQNVGVLLGAGIAFNLSTHWELHLEDVIVTGANPNFINLGMEFKF